MCTSNYSIQYIHAYTQTYVLPLGTAAKKILTSGRFSPPKATKDLSLVIKDSQHSLTLVVRHSLTGNALGLVASYPACGRVKLFSRGARTSYPLHVDVEPNGPLNAMLPVHVTRTFY